MPAKKSATKPKKPAASTTCSSSKESSKAADVSIGQQPAAAGKVKNVAKTKAKEPAAKNKKAAAVANDEDDVWAGLIPPKAKRSDVFLFSFSI